MASAPAAAAESAYRYAAPVVVERAAPFVRLPLPVSVYAHSRQAGLADLRLVDARGERVPFALLAPRPEQAQAAESLRPAALYPLPPRRPGEAEQRLPVEVQVVGDRITVRAQPAPTAARAASAAGSAAGAVPGWLIDLGEAGDAARRDEPAAAALRLAWSAPVAFTAAYELAVSDDLRQWRAAGGGQVLALEAGGQALTQRDVPLPAEAMSARTTAATAATMATMATMATRRSAAVALAASRPAAVRFVRLRWLDPARAPRLTGVQQVRAERLSIVVDPPTALTVQPQPAAAGVPKPGEPAGALVYDLGAVLPVITIDLALPPPQRVAPVRVQGRARPDEPWRDLAQTVFYRLERTHEGGQAVDRPPPLALPVHARHVRHLRLVPDERGGALPAAPLAVQAQLASLVLAAQGEPPYRLLAGSADAPAGALPVATLVPALDTERARFGQASLGGFAEDPAVARAEAWRQRLVAWRPALLWAVLLAGVAALALMVWRLARPRSS